mmetsp:Transcript_38246/g.94893  ORF Transcript_38246/g.94893 Transcript_38246/m.94893 type:complete len:249 (+) Transcript_38246:552-1298(+)
MSAALSSSCAFLALNLARSTASACARASPATLLRSPTALARSSRARLLSTMVSSRSISSTCSLLMVRYLTMVWRAVTSERQLFCSAISMDCSRSPSERSRCAAILAAASTASCASSAFLVYSMASFWMAASLRYALCAPSRLILASWRLAAASCHACSASSRSWLRRPPGPAGPLHHRGMSCLLPRHTFSRYAWSDACCHLRWSRLFISISLSDVSLLMPSAARRLSSAAVVVYVPSLAPLALLDTNA